MLLLRIAPILLVVLQVSLQSEADGCNLSKWEEFKSKFAKSYDNLEEENSRMENFFENLRAVEKHNSGSHTYEQGINEYSDMTYKEFAEFKLGLLPRTGRGKSPHVGVKFITEIDSTRQVPEEMDWSKSPEVVGSIKNQGNCKSCWAFGAVALIESAQHKLYKNLTEVIPLSEQQLVDCDTHFSKGCSGGNPFTVGNYLRKFGGLQADSTYPYESSESSYCEANKELIEDTTRDLGLFRPIWPNDEHLMKRIVAFHGPILVSIHVGPETMRYRGNGIVVDNSCKYNKVNNHAVLIVGYGHDEESGLDYWKIKNSWGENWGRDGYLYLARNVAEKEGHCGIALEPHTIYYDDDEKPAKDEVLSNSCNARRSRKPSRLPK